MKILLALVLSVNAFAFGWEDLSDPQMSSWSIQAMLKKALAAYYPLEIANNPVVKLQGNKYGIKNKNGEIALSCGERSHGMMAVQINSCEVGELDQVALAALMGVLSNSGVSESVGANHGYRLQAQNYDLRCLYRARSLIVSCGFLKGTYKGY